MVQPNHSSGFIAGGALFGVFAVITIMCGWEVPNNGIDLQPQLLGLVAYAAIICYLIFDSIRAKKNCLP